MQSSQFCISLCFFLFVCTCIALPESSPTINAAELYSMLSFSSPYYTGEESLIGKLPQNTRYYNFVKKFAKLQIQQHRETNDTGVYDVRGYLFIQFPYWYGGDPPQSYHDDDGSHRASRAQGQGEVRFWLNGMWSEKARQLAMVGTGSWVIEGKPIILDVFLNLNYAAQNNTNHYIGYISGTLSSLVVSANDPGYFDPFSIFSFPTLSNYNYSLLSQVQGTSLSNFDVTGNERPSYEGNTDCWMIMGESIVLEVEYAEGCSGHHQQHCSPLGAGDGLVGSLPRILVFTPIQCSAVERKMRYMATFQNTKYDQGFGLNSTVIGEASWDDEKKELFGIACRLLDPLNCAAIQVRNCTMRLSLTYTSIFTVRNDPKLVGQFRSTRQVDKSGYFMTINLTKSDGYGLVSLPDVRYEYTKLDEVRRSCAVKRPMRRGKMNTYPDVSSDNMGFELSVENSKGQHFAWISASPLWVGNHLYRKKNVNSVMQQSGDEEAEISKPYHTNASHSNISYMISLGSSSAELEFGSLFESLNWSTNGYYEVEIAAEGVYDAETGYLCMVGCRNGRNLAYISRDCEILVTLQFAPLTGERGGRSTGSITSMRAKTDPLHFEEMIICSTSYYAEEAERAIWRMDIEITMVVISNTFICIFVALQIFHVRRNSKVPSFVSLFMLLILSMGHLIPLISNLEDDYLRRNPIEHVKALKSGRIASNEVTVRLSSLVAFLLQLRLLQLVWTAKRRDVNGGSSWIGERKPGIVLLSLYAVGALLALLLNCTKEALLPQVNSKYVPQQKYSALGGLRSYGGLIMDGFLLPQVLLNAFTDSKEKALSRSFYGGISAVLVVPHAYNLYRLHNYPALDLRKTYYFANPDIGFYSIVSDSIVPLGIITLAVIIFLQQRRSGSP